MQLDATLHAHIASRLRRFERRRTEPGPHHRPAAVVLVLVEEGPGADVPGIAAPAHWSTEAALLLTRRAATLGRHAGQWSLPGGRNDAGETPEAAALRELHEEVGLRLPADAVLGCLDDYRTRSGYVITPVVAWAGTVAALQPNPDEVDSVHRIPVREFLRGDAPQLEAGEGEHPVLRMPIGERHIAAPTAAFLYQFREVCLADRATRVAHFDQPRFAWT